jgi:threonine dehydrogenase-like Zn-dependent dehydrogenase
MSKIFSVDQFKQWDAYTIREKPISSIDLMESAAGKCVEYMGGIFSFGESVAVFCGPGNNGGDGLAIARLLDRIVEKCTVYLTSSKKGTEEYETNLNRFKGKGKIVQLSEDEPLPEIEADILIDACKMAKAGSKISNNNYFGKGEGEKDTLPLCRIGWGFGMADKDIITGLCPGGRVRMERLADIVTYGRMDPELLVTHKFRGFDKIEEALLLMKEKPRDLIKPVVLLE